MYNGTIDITGIMLYRDKAEADGKSEDYITALSDLIAYLQSNQEEHRRQQNANFEKLNKRRTSSISTEPVTLYFYERRTDGSIRKQKYEAVEKKNSYEVKNCWKTRLSKHHDINKYVDILHHEMWTDAENDELMEELLARY